VLLYYNIIILYKVWLLNQRQLTYLLWRLKLLSNQTAHKFILVGSVGSGKTTSIKAVTETQFIDTEVKATEADALHRKQTTTTAMDYGQVHINGQKLHLYGAPGQRRFDFMVPVLSSGASGMLVMIDNGVKEPLKELDYYLETHKSFFQKKPAIIVITHYDDNRTDTTLLDYHCYVKNRGFSMPIMTIDARNPALVTKALQRLLLAVNAPAQQKVAFPKTPHLTFR
jgi:signal recognition particle receptor subunit beta